MSRRLTLHSTGVASLHQIQNGFDHDDGLQVDIPILGKNNNYCVSALKSTLLDIPGQ